MAQQSSLAVLLTTILLLRVTVVDASTPPFLGCTDQWSWGQPDNDDCYALDKYICRFQTAGTSSNISCKQDNAFYDYYIGGEQEDGSLQYESQVYAKVTITAYSEGCDADDATVRRCTIVVNDEPCNGCDNSEGDDYRQITMTDCSNLENGTIFSQPQQSIVVASDGGYLELQYNDTRCQHPAMDGTNYLKKIRTRATWRYRLPAGIGGPDNPSLEALAQLMEDTIGFYTPLLDSEFGFLLELSDNGWTSNYVSTNQGDTLVMESSWTTLFEAESTATTPSVINFLQDDALLQDYLTQVVQASANPTIASVTEVTASVLV